MSENKETSTINLNLDAIIYPEAPDNVEETESGKLVLDDTELQLPSDISFSLGKLTNAKYEKINEKHIIKITTTSENEIYFGILGANKVKYITYVETINDSIQNFISVSKADKNDGKDSNNDNNLSPSNVGSNSSSPQSEAPTNELPLPQTPPIRLKYRWGHGELEYNKLFERWETVFKPIPGKNGDIDVELTYSHLGTPHKNIKYIETTFQPIDRVNEPVGEKATSIFTGPLEPTKSQTVTNGTLFYGNDYICVTQLKITKVKIIYMDNTCIIIKDEAMINKLIQTNSNNGCAGCAGIVIIGISIPIIISLLLLL